MIRTNTQLLWLPLNLNYNFCCAAPGTTKICFHWINPPNKSFWYWWEYQHAWQINWYIFMLSNMEIDQMSNFVKWLASLFLYFVCVCGGGGGGVGVVVGLFILFCSSVICRRWLFFSVISSFQSVSFLSFLITCHTVLFLCTQSRSFLFSCIILLQITVSPIPSLSLPLSFEGCFRGFLFFFCGLSAMLRPSIHMLPETGRCSAGLMPFPTACWWLTDPVAITCVSVSAGWDSRGGCGRPSVPLLCNRRVQNSWCQFASGVLAGHSVLFATWI